MEEDFLGNFNDWDFDSQDSGDSIDEGLPPEPGEIALEIQNNAPDEEVRDQGPDVEERRLHPRQIPFRAEDPRVGPFAHQGRRGMIRLPEPDIGGRPDPEHFAVLQSYVTHLRAPPPKDQQEIIPGEEKEVFVLRNILAENTEPIRPHDGAGTFFTVYHGETEYTGLTHYLNSYPGGFIQLYHSQFNITESWFRVYRILQLSYENGQSWARDLLGTVQERFPDGGVIGFQIKSQTIIHQPKKINFMTSISEAYSYTAGYGAEDLYADLYQWLVWLNSRTREGDNYQDYYVDNWENYRVREFFVFILPHEVAGGCSNGVQHPASKLCPYLDFSFSQFNNCFIVAILVKLGVSEKRRQQQAEEIRTELKLKPKFPVYYRENQDKDLIAICNYLNVSVRIYSIIKTKNFWSRTIELVKEYSSGSLVWVNLFYNQRMRFGHYYLLKNKKMLDFISCINCGGWFDKTNIEAIINHRTDCTKCEICGNKQTANHDNYCRGNKRLTEADEKQKLLRVNYKEKTPKWAEGVIFADLETFQEEGEQIVYSSAWISIESLINYKNEPVRIESSHCRKYYGKGGFNIFCADITEQSGTCVFWNGSRFDFFFILKWALDNHIMVENFLKDEGSNKILSFSIKKMKFWDICLFTQCSLANGCRDFEVPAEYIKQDFDHSKMKNWDIVMQEKENVIIYNIYDVISMGIIYCNFASLIWDEFKYNVNEAVSLSHMSHDIWKDGFLTPEDQKQLKLPSIKKYTFLRRSLFGGRTVPSYPIYEESLTKMAFYDNWELLSEEIKNNLISLLEEHSDPLLYLDANSLYPSVCVKYPFPYGNSKYWSDEKNVTTYLRLFETIRNTKKEESITKYNCDNLKKSFIECDVECPNNLLIPFLFSRGGKGELISDLKDKKMQVYDGYTLIEASILGYKITNIYNILRFTKLDYILKSFMETCHKKKQENAKKPVAYNLWKLSMNSLTGKFSQAMIQLDCSFVYGDEKFNDPSFVSLIKKIEIILVDQKIDRFIVYSQDPEARPTKMSQLGTCCLALSRVWMSQITRAIGSYWNPDKLIYYCDTDSILVKRSSITSMSVSQKNIYIGDMLGQLKDELPGCIITRSCFLAPKTYYIEYIDKASKQLKAIIRSKGVPQPTRFFKKGKMDLAEMKKIPFKPENDDLKDIVFSLCSRTGEIIESKNWVDFNFFKAMFEKNWVVIATFGRLNRYLVTKDNKAGVIKMDLESQRTINKTNWWQNGKRIIIDNYSIPPGHALDV